uniref:Ovule protein n=1 Tax=Brugia timori TaxID=42155 RepID=A0A0R3QFN3_9BILA
LLSSHYFWGHPVRCTNHGCTFTLFWTYLCAESKISQFYRTIHSKKDIV